ncbi:hypothetical protein [Paenibacillus odorifer]|uniref:hypothetical protein n=1 Tax=Paenibacillus odorifer TaxID=189426 RepID=UPI00096F09E4|nr:hypothetical protein [Paenibacillus odorifer]OMD08373.1 hypothetical protein BJP50_07220 [Paenibacillus odorifer]
MSEKVKLTKAQEIEIQKLIESNDKEDIVSDHAQGAWMNDSPLNEISLDILIRALYFGYDTERTLEEKLVESYEKGYSLLPQHESNKAYRLGIERALEAFDIKVKGINA